MDLWHVLVALVGGGGVGSLLTAILSERRKDKGEEWSRIKEILDRVDKEHTEDRQNIAKLHEDRLTDRMELATLRTENELLKNKIAALEQHP